MSRDVAVYLIEQAHADINMITPDGQTPLDMSDSMAVVRLIIKHRVPPADELIEKYLQHRRIRLCSLRKKLDQLSVFVAGRPRDFFNISLFSMNFAVFFLLMLPSFT